MPNPGNTHHAPIARRYASQRVLRRSGAFELVSAMPVDEGSPVTLVRPVGRLGAEAEAALRRVERAHGALVHPRVAGARLVRIGSGRSLAVELDAPATIDGTEVMRRLIHARGRLSYAQADAFVFSVREVMRLAHATVVDGATLTFGRFCLGNVIVGEDGTWWLIGLGHNVVTDRLDGSLATDEAIFAAPEVALGAGPTASSDFVATLMLKRAVAHVVDVPDEIARAFAGGTDPTAQRIAELAFWFERCVAGELPARRPPLSEVEARVTEFADLIGQGLDPEGFERVLAQHADPVQRLHPRRAYRLELGVDGAWARLGGGERIVLGGAPGRILAALASARDEPVSTGHLAAAGWPGEKMVPRAAANRVYVTMHKLRTLGLGEHVQRLRGGYRLEGVVVEVVPETCDNRS